LRWHNETFILWRLPDARPGEGDVVATRGDGRKVLRCAISSPLASFTGSQLLEGPLYAGEGVGTIRDIPAAGDLVRRLWK
jgi:hypothetical protein